MNEQERINPCAGCPFVNGVPKDAIEQGEPTVMLCHESGCLDGNGMKDYVCEGWRLDRELDEMLDSPSYD